MAKIPAIYGAYTANILKDAVWSANVAVSTSYDVATLGAFNPAARVRWGVATVTITATIASALGDILCIPMHNLVGAVLTLSNASGFSQVLTPPAVQANGFPPTWVVDLKALDSNTSHRTTTAWVFTIASNPANVVMGGAIAIYGPKTTFLDNARGDNFEWGFREWEQHHTKTIVNDYGTRYTVDYATATRGVDVTLRAKAAGIAAFRDWFRANHGEGRPGLFWPDPNVVDGYFGTWPPLFEVERQFTSVNPIAISFTELSKGQVIA